MAKKESALADLPLAKQLVEAERRLARQEEDCRARGVLLSLAHIRYALGLDEAQWQEWLLGAMAAGGDETALLAARRALLQQWLRRAWVQASECLSGSAGGQKQICVELAQALAAPSVSDEEAELSLECFLGLEQE